MIRYLYISWNDHHNKTSYNIYHRALSHLFFLWWKRWRSIKRRFLCPNLDTISDFRNVLHHNNDNVGKTGNTWLTTLYSDLLSVWQSVFHMMFVSHKQFQHGRVWCQDNSYIICHCRTSIGLAKKTRLFYLGLLTSAWVLVIVSLQRAVLFFETWPSPSQLDCHFNFS